MNYRRRQLFKALIVSLCSSGGDSALLTAIHPAAPVVSPRLPSSYISPALDGPNLLISLEANTSAGLLKGLQKDEVLRVLDANTLKLKKNGIVTLAGVRMPTPGTGNFQSP